MDISLVSGHTSSQFNSRCVVIRAVMELRVKSFLHVLKHFIKNMHHDGFPPADNTFVEIIGVY